MGREIKRVPLDFDWEQDKVWHGFLMPDSLSEEQCAACNGSGYSTYAKNLQDRWYGYVPFDPAETGSDRLTASTPAVRAFAERNVTRSPEFYGRGEHAIVREAERLCELWNSQWSHHLHQDDVDALVAGRRLMDFTHTWVTGDGWKPIDPAPIVTAAQINEWSLSGLGHDAINCMMVVNAACERAGESATCPACQGHGGVERYPGQRAEAEAWTKTEPPAGNGWQLWETVSEGSPISPVFATSDELAAWMSNPERGSRWVPPAVAAKFIKAGWAPSFASTPETGLVSGVEFVGAGGDDDA